MSSIDARFNTVGEMLALLERRVVQLERDLASLQAQVGQPTGTRQPEGSPNVRANLADPGQLDRSLEEDFMSKKHYEMLARLIGEARGNHPDAEQRLALASFASSLASELATDNPRFDETRFMRAIATYEQTRREWRERKSRGDFSSEKFEVG